MKDNVVRLTSTATGHSFPSEHTMNAATVFGGITVDYGADGKLLVDGAKVKDMIPGAAGTIASCFLQMLYITFVFPWCLRRFEKPTGC